MLRKSERLVSYPVQTRAVIYGDRTGAFRFLVGHWSGVGIRPARLSLGQYAKEPTMPVVEQYARAHVVTDADPLLGDRGAVPVVLCYVPGSDSGSVRVALAGSCPPESTVPRELLEQGLHMPAGLGEVQVWPSSRVQAVVEFQTARGVSVVQIENKVLNRFLSRTYAA